MINNVLIYGFDENDVNLIKSVFNEKEFCVFKTDFSADLIALPYCAIIISCKDFAEDDYEKLVSFYGDVDVFSESVIFIGKFDYGVNKHKKFFYYSDMNEFIANGKYLVLTTKKRERKRHTFSSTLCLAIRILAEIKNNPGVTTAYMAEKFEVSLRTIQRNIETLNMAGESIIKDKNTAGWRLEFDESLLLLQALPVENERNMMADRSIENEKN